MKTADVNTNAATAENCTIGDPAQRTVEMPIWESSLTDASESAARHHGSSVLTHLLPISYDLLPPRSVQGYASEALLRRHCGPDYLRVAECAQWCAGTPHIP